MKNPFSINNLLFPDYEHVEITKDYYMRKVQSGDWKDKFIFGVTEIDRGFYEVDPLVNAGALWFGATGSGKSKGMKFTVYTHYATNCENTLYVLFDSEKAATDYQLLKEFTDNVVVATMSTAKFTPLMDYVRTEYDARKREFDRVGASDIYEYDREMMKKGQKSLARIMLIFEEFHSLIDDPKVMLARNLDRPETAAGKMKILARVARSSGMYLFIATQRATSDDVPSDIKPWIKIPIGFKVATTADAHAAGLEKATEVPVDKPGRCVYGQNYWMQYPFINDAFFKILLEKSKKKFNARFLTLNVKDMQKALSGMDAENYVYVKPFKEVVDGHDQFTKTLIAKRFLEQFGFEVSKQDSDGYFCKLFATRGDKKFIVYTPPDASGGDGYGRNSMGKSTISNVRESIKDFKCNGLINFSFDGQSDDLEDICNDGGIHLSFEDLKYAANVIDNQEKFTEEDLAGKLKNIPLHESYSIEGKSEDDGEDAPFRSSARNRRSSNRF